MKSKEIAIFQCRIIKAEGSSILCQITNVALTQGQDLPDAVAYGIQAARTTIRIRGAICQDLSAQIGSPS